MVVSRAGVASQGAGGHSGPLMKVQHENQEPLPLP